MTQMYPLPAKEREMKVLTSGLECVHKEEKFDRVIIQTYIHTSVSLKILYNYLSIYNFLHLTKNLINRNIFESGIKTHIQ
jgi:hypothetical protein